MTFKKKSLTLVVLGQLVLVQLLVTQVVAEHTQQLQAHGSHGSSSEVTTTTTTTTEINNMAPRLDSAGNILNAHDGTTQLFPGHSGYYMHAAEYGLCKEPPQTGCQREANDCGFRLDHNISIYHSDSLASGSWRFLGHAITPAQRPAGILYRPHAVWNPTTMRVVLWWNYVLPSGGYAGYAAATAAGPGGPFTTVVPSVNVTQPKSSGDFAISVGPAGSHGYLAYSHDYWMYLEVLTPDLLHSTGRRISIQGQPHFPQYFVEAPAFFRHAGWLYLTFGHCCCFCYQGSGIFLWRARSAEGPWQQQAGNLACIPPAAEAAVTLPPAVVDAQPTPGQGCLYNNSHDVSATRSQQNYVIEVATKSGPVLLWTGDRWMQAPDGLKGHDPQFWVPLTFEAAGGGSGGGVVMKPLRWVDSFVVRDILTTAAT